MAPGGARRRCSASRTGEIANGWPDHAYCCLLLSLYLVSAPCCCSCCSCVAPAALRIVSGTSNSRNKLLTMATKASVHLTPAEPRVKYSDRSDCVLPGLCRRSQTVQTQPDSADAARQCRRSQIVQTQPDSADAAVLSLHLCIYLSVGMSLSDCCFSPRAVHRFAREREEENFADHYGRHG